MDPIGLVLLALGIMQGRGAGGAAPAAPGAAIKLPGGTPPWPQTMPAGLPKFPGGWEFDEPPPAAVQARAKQLVTKLWAQGAGATSTEQTAGRWITYRAEVVASGNKGIVAYRLKAPVAPPRLPRAPSKSGPEVSRAPRPKPPKKAGVKVVRSPGLPQATAHNVDVQVGPAQLDPVQLPELHKGDGLKPQPKNPNVILLQQLLTQRGIPVEADGRFGNDTQTAVIAFQVQHGLAPADPVEELRKRGFGAVKVATWRALLETRA
jgi:hypothetical protein